MAFWDGMKLWEKMLLVLAIAMGVTFSFAMGRLTYNKRRTARHLKLAEAQKAHLENVRSSRHIIQLKGEDIPFGIKALEAGIVVDGVVVSRPATPLSDRPSRSQQTLVERESETTNTTPSPTLRYSEPTLHQTSKPPFGYQPSPYVTLPPVALRPGRTANSPIRSSFPTAPAGNWSPPYAEPLWTQRRTLSDPSAVQTDSSPQPPPVLYHPQAKFPQGPDPSALARLEGRPYSSRRRSGTPRTRSPFSCPSNVPSLVHTPSQTPSMSSSRSASPPGKQRSPPLQVVSEGSPGESSGRSDSSSSTEGDIPLPISSRRPRAVTARSSPSVPTYNHVPETVRGDLSLLHHHRLSHAAEVGQLLPRRNRAVSEHSPGTPPIPSPYTGAFVSPAVADHVYALDIALPRPAFSKQPVPYISNRSSYQARPFSNPTLLSAIASGPQIQHTRFSENFESPQPPNYVDSSMQTTITADEITERDSSPKAAPRKLKKNRRQNSMDFDLEAQR